MESRSHIASFTFEAVDASSAVSNSELNAIGKVHLVQQEASIQELQDFMEGRVECVFICNSSENSTDVLEMVLKSFQTEKKG